MGRPGTFIKGQKKPNQGKRGPNKATKEIKQMIINALGKVGGEQYLAEQAQKNPTAFMGLIGKVLPMQLTGDGGGPVQGKWVIEITNPK